MDYLTYSEKLDYLLEMTRKGRFTSLQQASDKYNCSISTIKRMLNILRIKGYNIKYSRDEKKFYLKF
jgi:biotin operon repressor